MNLTIKKKVGWKKIYLHILNSKYQIIKEIKLDFINDSCHINIKDKKAKFIYLTNKIKKSQVLILSENLSSVILSYNRKSKSYKFDLDTVNCNNYGKIQTIILEDKKNLYYRKDNQKIINIYTPSNFSKNKKYNLLIMFDSQNLFNQEKIGIYTTKNDRYGGWQVETSLENIKRRYQEEFIVVGIDNSDRYRSFELTPNQENWEMKRNYKKFFNITNTHLDNLCAFIEETLLPYIKNHFQITNFIGIGGSSSGGLASIYCGLKIPNTFKFILSFTPAIGFATDSSVINLYSNFLVNQKDFPYIFFFQGKNGDLENILYRANKNFAKNLIKSGIPKDKIERYIEPTAYHNEDPWRYSFNYAMDKAIKQK